MASYEIKFLDLLDIELESSFLVLARNMGTLTKVKTWGYLLLGGDGPILVDTGAVNAEIMGNVGMTAVISEEMQLANQLARFGVALRDVRWVLHTHHHIDHAGQDHLFSMKQTVVTNRRELEYSASGIMAAQYPPEYVKHHIDRLHTPGALRLLDLELSGPDEIAPGIVCEAAGGHTEGSMNVIVDTALGKACICGDVVYDIQNQIVDPIYQVLENEPQSTGNQGTSKRQERAAIKKALNAGDILMPIHDHPARVRNGTVVGRFLGDSLEAGETPIEHRMISELVLAPGSFVRVGVVAGRSGRVAASPRMRGCMGKTPRHAQGVQTPRKHHETSRRGHWATWARAASTSGSDRRRRSAGSTSRTRNDGRTRGSFCPSENIEVRCPPRASAW